MSSVKGGFHGASDRPDPTTAASRIFLAHAREDKAQVRKLYDDLRARGFQPWLDEEDLRAGQIWKTEIPKAIRQAKLFLACLSSRSVDKVGYVQSEFRQALSVFGERPPGSIYLIPVRLDECEVPDLQIPDRGLSLQDIQWVDLWQEDGLDQLVADLEYALRVASSPAQVVGEVPPTTIRSPEPAAPRSKVAPLPEPIDRDTLAANQKWKYIAAIVGATAAVAAVLALLERIPIGGKTSRETATSEPSSAPSPEELRDCNQCPLMMGLPAGTFTMGSAHGLEYERPPHPVAVPAFALGKYEVTFEEWDACVADGGCNGYEPKSEGWGRGRQPVIHVSWDDAKSYVEWLSKATGASYRLPSDAEWEYAARAGKQSVYWWGDADPTAEQANFAFNIGKTTEAGSYPANPWGLHDMNGNVWEWVEDCWNGNYDAPGRPDDGAPWLQGKCSERVIRGGSWNNSDPVNLHSAFRFGYATGERHDALGFRVARTLPRATP